MAQLTALTHQPACTSAEAEEILTTLREVYRRDDEASEAVRYMLEQMVGREAVSL